VIGCIGAVHKVYADTSKNNFCEEIMNWEYCSHILKSEGFFGQTIKSDSLDKLLMESGSDRWELISVVAINPVGESTKLLLVFKRPKI
jgi:hypothetical protein